jgi:hypothetical protein
MPHHPRGHSPAVASRLPRLNQATGSFGRMEGQTFLHMVQRKVAWMQKSAQRMVELAEG